MNNSFINKAGTIPKCQLLKSKNLEVLERQKFILNLKFSLFIYFFNYLENCENYKPLGSNDEELDGRKKLENREKMPLPSRLPPLIFSSSLPSSSRTGKNTKEEEDIMRRIVSQKLHKL